MGSLVVSRLDIKMRTLVAHSITIKQYESSKNWRVDWEDLEGSHTKWFDTFEELSRYVEGELL